MTIFVGTAAGAVMSWRGSPSCAEVEQALAAHVIAAHGARMPVGATLTVHQVGNLGESLAYLASSEHDGPELRLEATNVFKPLSPESGTGVDLTWFYFDPADPLKDFVIVQEVKSSPAATPHYSRSLKSDTEKLFGPDDAQRLETRLQFWAFKFDVQHPGLGYKERILSLGSDAAASLTRVQLRLTFVHEMAQSRVDVAMKRVVEHAVQVARWPASLVTGWAIGVTDLGNVLHRCAVDQ